MSLQKKVSFGRIHFKEINSSKFLAIFCRITFCFLMVAGFWQGNVGLLQKTQRGHLTSSDNL